MATKLLITWLVGGRDSEYAMAFMEDTYGTALPIAFNSPATAKPKENSN